MTPRRITEITVETDETFTLRFGAGSSSARCPRCGSRSAAFTHPQAAALFWAAVRAVCGQIEMEQVHTARTSSGSSVICLDSLRRAAPLLSGKSILQMHQTQIHPIKENPK